MQKRIIYHIVFWIAYILFKSYLQFDFARDTISVNMLLTVIAAQAAFLLVKLPMVYTLFFIIDKYLARQWNISKTILGITGLLVASLALFMPIKQYLVLGVIYGVNASLQDALSLSSILATIFILGFVCSIAVAIKLVRSGMRQGKIQQEMVKRKLETELQFLKAQINPHFFFNTLNNIYALSRKKSDETPAVIMKLSKLFRFILYEAQKKFISIGAEIQVVENYIELERIRYNDKLKIIFNRSIDNEARSVAPLILLPFVENAFKHGASESRFNSYIHIDLKVEQASLYFTCANSKAEELVKSDSEKIGLGNIRRQLELLYPDHLLEISDTNAEFKVLLKLNLNNHTA